MKTSLVPTAILATLTLLGALAVPGPARAGERRALIDFDSGRVRAPHVIATVPDTEPVRFREQDLSGPRVGFSFAPGDGEMYRTMKDHGMGRMVSQFGWHFEHTVTPLGGGPALVTEAIPLFGGVEYGMFIPSLTFALGVRLPSGLEFGAGPSFTLSNSQGQARAGLVLAAGKTLDYSGVNIPLNLAVSTNKDGTRVTLIAGYSIRRATR
jgi:hypothetical protein